MVEINVKNVISWVVFTMAILGYISAWASTGPIQQTLELLQSASFFMLIAIFLRFP